MNMSEYVYSTGKKKNYSNKTHTLTFKSLKFKSSTKFCFISNYSYIVIIFFLLALLILGVYENLFNTCVEY